MTSQRKIGSADNMFPVIDQTSMYMCMLRLLDNMHQLPVNMMEYTAEYASQTFSRLSAVPHATLQQVCFQPVCCGVSGRLSFFWS